VTNDRKSIQAAAQAALWTISNGKCYAPGCPFPVIVEVRPGVYKKNAQIAHIHGVKAPRFRPGMAVEERDSFKNLILLCLPHHAEVDDKKYGERMYPPEKLREWKMKHEGDHAATLRMIGPIDVDTFMDRLADAFEPPTRRLEALAEQLEKTGTLNANSVAELRVIISALRDNPLGPDPRTVGQLMDAVIMLGGRDFPRTVAQFDGRCHYDEQGKSIPLSVRIATSNRSTLADPRAGHRLRLLRRRAPGRTSTASPSGAGRTGAGCPSRRATGGCRPPCG